MMMRPGTALEVTIEQVRWFRAVRGHLAGPGSPSAAQAAHTILGAQAQQLAPALHALSMRMIDRPTAKQLAEQIFDDERRSLVWTWGQRDTLHVYDAQRDWRSIVAARSQWSPGGRGGEMPSQATIARARAFVDAARGPITRAAMDDIVPARYVNDLAERAKMANMDPRRLAASRLIWRLAQDGHVSLAANIGAERTYAARGLWFPKLEWCDDANAHDAATELTRRYLAIHGPATVQDIAHFFNARVSTARTWIASLEDELLPVRCGNRDDLLSLRCDADELTHSPPASTAQWPVRMLPLWESMLMAHKDRMWTVKAEPERKAIWRKAAYVAAVVLARGVIIATWTHKKKSSYLDIAITPLSGWRQRIHGPATRREANAVAQHLGLPEARVTIE